MLAALSPLDGRYAEKTAELRKFLSEDAFIIFRLHTEILWLLHLMQWQKKGVLSFKGRLTDEQQKILVQMAVDVFGDPSYVQKVKEFEKRTAHDVKAIEYCLADVLKAKGFGSEIISLIHFACTSEDINNIAYAMMLRQAVSDSILPQLKKIHAKLVGFAEKHHNLAMLARTHGQKATPTTLGKEMAIFAARLQQQIDILRSTKQVAKINGASGNYNAHCLAFPKAPWLEIARDFIENVTGFVMNPLTTQIEPHDGIAQLCSVLSHVSVIGISLCRDMWGYISLAYFKQNLVKDEVGSSTMPHKVNPIHFENAEGNFGLVVALAQHLATKLPISRFQRDLSDSTVLRSLGTLFGHLLLALRSLDQGLGQLAVDSDVIHRDLSESWELLGEALQTALRAHGVADAYERMKAATRGQAMSRTHYLQMVEAATELDVETKRGLSVLTPSTYLGLASSLALSVCSIKSSN